MQENKNVLKEAIDLINKSRMDSYRYLNKEVNNLYFNLGKILDEAYSDLDIDTELGLKTVSVLQELSYQFGTGWNSKLLKHCLRFYRTFKDNKDIEGIIENINWPILRELSQVEDPLKREFYIHLARLNNWSFEEFCLAIANNLYERMVLSEDPEEFLKEELGKLSEEKFDSTAFIFNDSTLLNYMQLDHQYFGDDLKTELILEIEKELSSITSFLCHVNRDYALNLHGVEDSIDLLYYHRMLKSLIAMDIYIGKPSQFKTEKMEFHLNYLEQFEMDEDENKPIGLIICADVDTDTVDMTAISTDEESTKILVQSPSIKFLSQAILDRMRLLKQQRLPEIVDNLADEEETK